MASNLWTTTDTGKPVAVSPLSMGLRLQPRPFPGLSGPVGQVVLGVGLRPRSDRRHGADARQRTPRHVRGLGRLEERPQALSQPPLDLGRLRDGQAGVAPPAGRRRAYPRRSAARARRIRTAACPRVGRSTSTWPTRSTRRVSRRTRSFPTSPATTRTTGGPTGCPIAASIPATCRTCSWPGETSA